MDHSPEFLKVVNEVRPRIKEISIDEARVRLAQNPKTILIDVRAGDAVAIPPGKKHKLWNTGPEVLRLLCCCAPCYEHSDTMITEG